jgi:hypothetical protein
MCFDRMTAERFIGEHFTSREVAAFRACAVPAMQADYFRYCAVLALGGIYCDIDLRCVRPLEPLVDTLEGGLLFRQHHGPMINGFFVFKTADHPLMRLALEVATANIELRLEASVSLVTGPWIFTGLSGLHQLGSISAARRIVDKEIRQLTDSLLAVVGDYSRVADAFEDVQIESVDSAAQWVGYSIPLAYKRGDAHWVRWDSRRESIYR